MFNPLKSFKLFIALFIISLLSSCKAVVYTPNRNPIPLYKQKGDVYVDASTNLFSKVDLTAGVAPVNGLGLYAGYNASGYTSRTTTIDSPIITNTKLYRGNMINLGAGYFVPQDISPNLRFEVFGDLGLGQFKNKSTGETNAFFNGKYTRIGIMPNIGYTSTDQIFSIAYSLRACNIRFHSAEINNVPYYSDDYKRYSRKHDYNMMEHAVMARVGTEAVKLQLQVAVQQNIGADDYLDPLPPYNMSINFGIVFTPNYLKANQ
jgi:hypothetical protein